MNEKVFMSGVDCRNGIMTPWSLEYPFSRTDAGRSISHRPRQSNDCTVRALALARGIAYDDAYDALVAEGRKCERGFDMPRWLNAQPWARKIAFPAIKGQRRMNPAGFCTRYSTGHYICRVAKHVFAVVDGVVMDNHAERPDRCIYTAWEIA